MSAREKQSVKPEEVEGVEEGAFALEDVYNELIGRLQQAPVPALGSEQVQDTDEELLQRLSSAPVSRAQQEGSEDTDAELLQRLSSAPAVKVREEQEEDIDAELLQRLSSAPPITGQKQEELDVEGELLQKLSSIPASPKPKPEELSIEDELLQKLSSLPASTSKSGEETDVEGELLQKLSSLPSSAKPKEEFLDTVYDDLTKQLSSLPAATQYAEKNIPFNGRFVTAIHPALLGDGDFSVLKNLCYTSAGIKTIKKATLFDTLSHVYVISSLVVDDIIAFQTYPADSSWTSIGIFFSSSSDPTPFSSPDKSYTIAYKYSTSTAYTVGNLALVSLPPYTYYLECVSSGTTEASQPDFNSYPYDSIITDGTVEWAKRKGDLKGQFTRSPDNTVVYTNGYHNLIYGGANHRVGAVFNVNATTSLGSELVSNGDFSIEPDVYWNWGTAWELKEGSARPIDVGILSQSIMVSPGKLYRLQFYIYNYVCTITPYIGRTAGTPVSDYSGTYTQYIRAVTSDGLLFAASGGSPPYTNAWIDNVSVREVYDIYEGADITQPLSEQLTTPDSLAVLFEASDGTIILDIGSPLSISGINFSVFSPNTLSTSTVSIYHYTSSGWVAGTITSDTTNCLFQSGTVSFTFSQSDVITYLHDQYLYWYRYILAPSSDTLPSTISLYYLTVVTTVQNIPNIWDGTVYPPALFCIQRSSTTLADATMGVARRENSFSYISGWTPTAGTVAPLYNYTTYYVAHTAPLIGFKIRFATLTVNNQTTVFSNTNAASISVSYWNGSSWVSVSGLIDGTVDSATGATHAVDGTITWTPVTDGSERKKTLLYGSPLYCYRIVSSVAFSSNTCVDAVEVIPYTPPVKMFKACAMWKNRLVLAGKDIGPDKNIILMSAPNSPYILSGNQIIVLYAGADTEPITRLVSIFSRYSTSTQETLIAFKEDEMYFVDGDSVEDTKVLAVSSSIGASYPATVVSCDLGIRIIEGVNRAVIIFANASGVYLFDNATVISISDDILPDLRDVDDANAFYDEKRSWYHFICYRSSEWKEYVFDLIYKKWFEVDRGSEKIYAGDGVYGFAPNAVYALNNSTDTYTATLTTAIKPLGNTYNMQYVLRRLVLLTTAGSSVSMNINITSDVDSASISSLVPSTILSSPINLNVIGSYFYFTISITGASDFELANMSALFREKRVRI